MVKRSPTRSSLRFVAILSALLGIQLAVAAAPWGDFGPSVATYGPHGFCYGSSIFGEFGRSIRSEIFVTHDVYSRADGTPYRRTEVIRAINRSVAVIPNIDVGVFNTNDTFTGRTLPFAYNEVYNVPRATATYDNDRAVVEYDGVGINTAGVCRVRPSG